MAIAMTGLPVLAQSSVFYDAPANVIYDELKQWGTMYVQLLGSGAPAPDADSFAFSNGAMNSPLFSPVRAAMSIVGEAAGTQVCSTTTIDAGPGTIDEDLIAYLTMGKISTSLTNGGATAAHLTAILNSSNVQYEIEGDVLVSIGLTPSIVTTVPGAKQYTTVTASTAEWISELGVLAPAWAAQRDFSQEGKRQLLGLPSEVEAFTGQIRDWATVNGVALTMYQVQANFGLYGSLPVIVAVYQSGSDSGCILIDGVKENVDGPVVSGSPIDPRGLLDLHGGSFVTTTGVQVVESKSELCAHCQEVGSDETSRNSVAACHGASTSSRAHHHAARPDYSPTADSRGVRLVDNTCVRDDCKGLYLHQLRRGSGWRRDCVPHETKVRVSGAVPYSGPITYAIASRRTLRRRLLAVTMSA